MKPREPASSGPARLRASYPRPDAPEHFLLGLQRTIGSQAVLRMLRTHAEGSDTGSAAVLHGGFVQRDQKAPDAKQVAAERVAAAKKKLRAKFDLGEISEENKTTWTEDELARC